MCGGPISYKSQLHTIGALSDTESKYIATTEAMKEAIWLQGLTRELEVLNGVVELFSDRQSSIK